jgi:hypothetical protein
MAGRSMDGEGCEGSSEAEELKDKNVEWPMLNVQCRRSARSGVSLCAMEIVVLVVLPRNGAKIAQRMQLNLCDLLCVLATWSLP